MNEIHHALHTPTRRGCGRPIRVVVGGAIAIACLVTASLAAAQHTAQMPPRQIPIGQVFTFLFLMLGPFKVIGPFAALTNGADVTLIRKIAVRATLFASGGLLVAMLLGETILSRYTIPVPVLGLTGGIILFLVALQNVLKEFTPEPRDEPSARASPTPTMNVALTPLAFPTLVTPYGIAAVVVFVALSEGIQDRLIVGAIVLALMLLNLAVMLVSPHRGKALGALLAVLGAVLGVIQVALGLQIINNSLKAMGVL